MTKITAAVATGALALVCGVGAFADEKGPPRVEWEGKVFGAYEKALKDKKLLVVYFRKDYCIQSKGPCQHCAPVDQIMQGSEVAALADRAVWAWQTEGHDDEKKNVARLMEQLKIDHYPTVVVLEVNEKLLKERGRVEGALEKGRFLEKFRALLTGEPRR